LQFCAAVARSHALAIMCLLSALALDCANLGLRGRDEHPYITAAERLAAIKHAQVWQRTDVRAMNIRRGPQGEGAFAPDATVTCKYRKETFTGASPKFACALSEEDQVKVRYGRTNNEIFAGVASTRLLWALGFGADALYPVHVVCHGCPPALPGEPKRAATCGSTTRRSNGRCRAARWRRRAREPDGRGPSSISSTSAPAARRARTATRSSCSR